MVKEVRCFHLPIQFLQFKMKPSMYTPFPEPSHPLNSSSPRDEPLAGVGAEEEGQRCPSSPPRHRLGRRCSETQVTTVSAPAAFCMAATNYPLKFIGSRDARRWVFKLTAASAPLPLIPRRHLVLLRRRPTSVPPTISYTPNLHLRPRLEVFSFPPSVGSRSRVHLPPSHPLIPHSGGLAPSC